MKPFYCVLSGALATVALAAPFDETLSERATTPKVYLAGDSTMALGGGGTGTQGTYSSPPSFPKSLRNTNHLRLGCLPPLLPHRCNRNQRRRRRPLCPLLHKRRALHNPHQRRRIRRHRHHRIWAQRRGLPLPHRQRTLRLRRLRHRNLHHRRRRRRANLRHVPYQRGQSPDRQRRKSHHLLTYPR